MTTADAAGAPTDTDFTRLPDLASRQLGGAVVWANDELFAERENLIKPEDPTYSTYTFGHKGQVYDGWETRRRREPGHDWALVRLGLPGVVRGKASYMSPEQCLGDPVDQRCDVFALGIAWVLRFRAGHWRTVAI